MKISALRLHNVKRFAGRGVAIEGISDGVNVLCAVNEFGKSTSFEALHALFFQSHASTAGDVRNLRPYSGGNPMVEADIIVGENPYRLTKQFYGGGSARVVDLATGRLVAQADEAENFIADLIKGGASGPAGLLWVRQGVTGIEKRSRTEEESEKQVRASLLESVQGEVEAVTGGRRMAEILAASAEACSTLVTTTGRPKTGGRYAAELDKRDRLAAEEQQLSVEVATLREALDRRSSILRRLVELENPEDRSARRNAVEAAQAAFDGAKAQSDKLRTAEAELSLARERRDTAERDLQGFRDALEQERELQNEVQTLKRRSDEAVDRRSDAAAAIETARTEADTAETEVQEARELLARLDAVTKASEASERLVILKGRLSQVEAARQALEEHEAQLTQLKIPSGAIDELATQDIEIARILAVREAAHPSVIIAYEAGAMDLVAMDGAPLNDAEERGYDGHAQLFVPGIGTITLRSNQPAQADDGLAQIEAKRETLLASMGVKDLAAAREQEVVAQQLDSKMRELRAQLVLLAPEGLAKLREEVAAYGTCEVEPTELKADPVLTHAALEDAEERRKQASQKLREAEPARDNASEAFIKAETALAALQGRIEHIIAVLGPEDMRGEREQALTTAFEKSNAAFGEAETTATGLRATSIGVESTQAALTRAASVEQAVITEINQLRETLAGLNAQISARSDEAIEEKWRETFDALTAAQSRVAAFERELAVLNRLRAALETARSNARELYLGPVITELKPLLGLLFEDVAITFDDKTLLPQTIKRNGQEEEVERLSGGMREQLSVLTRLAFARLLARDGKPAPVILDDALVYSDDDRIEKMFDALHRQARDQQIIVFSCRQRAFQRLGGNILQMIDWNP